MARISEQLLVRLLAFDLAPQGQLAPEPRHREVVASAAELRPDQRTPETLPGLLSHRPRHPFPGGDVLEGTDVSVAPLQPEHREADTQTRERRERREAEQVERRREGMNASVAEDRHARRKPLDLVGQSEFLVERNDVPVAEEEVVVIALDQVAVAHVERRGLAAEARPALVDVTFVSRFGQAERHGEAGDSGADHGDPHVGRGSALVLRNERPPYRTTSTTRPTIVIGTRSTKRRSSRNDTAPRPPAPTARTPTRTPASRSRPSPARQAQRERGR